MFPCVCLLEHCHGDLPGLSSPAGKAQTSKNVKHRRLRGVPSMLRLAGLTLFGAVAAIPTRSVPGAYDGTGDLLAPVLLEAVNGECYPEGYVGVHDAIHFADATTGHSNLNGLGNGVVPTEIGATEGEQAMYILNVGTTKTGEQIDVRVQASETYQVSSPAKNGLFNGFGQINMKGTLSTATGADAPLGDNKTEAYFTFTFMVGGVPYVMEEGFLFTFFDFDDAGDGQFEECISFDASLNVLTWEPSELASTPVAAPTIFPAEAGSGSGEAGSGEGGSGGRTRLQSGSGEQGSGSGASTGGWLRYFSVTPGGGVANPESPYVLNEYQAAAPIVLGARRGRRRAARIQLSVGLGRSSRAATSCLHRQPRLAPTALPPSTRLCRPARRRRRPRRRRRLVARRGAALAGWRWRGAGAGAGAARARAGARDGGGGGGGGGGDAPRGTRSRNGMHGLQHQLVRGRPRAQVGPPLQYTGGATLQERGCDGVDASTAPTTGLHRRDGSARGAAEL